MCNEEVITLRKVRSTWVKMNYDDLTNSRTQTSCKMHGVAWTKYPEGAWPAKFFIEGRGNKKNVERKLKNVRPKEKKRLRFKLCSCERFFIIFNIILRSLCIPLISLSTITPPLLLIFLLALSKRSQPTISLPPNPLGYIFRLLSFSLSPFVLLLPSFGFILPSYILLVLFLVFLLSSFVFLLSPFVLPLPSLTPSASMTNVTNNEK